MKITYKVALITLAAFLLLGAAVVFAATATYKTRSGDTLSSVAAKYGMTVEQLAAANPDAKLTSRQTLTVIVADPTPTPTPTPPPASGEIRMTAYTTSYTWWDNTPAGSADIALPVIHSKAGGTGTYADPITLAVGHSITGGVSTPDFPAGTLFYIPNVRAYFIVEDVCGDGSKPQNGPCHKLNAEAKSTGATVWLDMWIDGASVSKSAANACAEALTDGHLAIQNPAANYAVVEGSVIQNGACRTQYGDTPVTQ